MCNNLNFNLQFRIEKPLPYQLISKIVFRVAENLNKAESKIKKAESKINRNILTGIKLYTMKYALRRLG